MPIIPASRLRRLALLLSLLVLPLGRIQAALAQDDILTRLPAAQIEAQLPAEPPVSYYFYAERLLKSGDDVDALRWFYIGQLRLRISLQAQPGQDTRPLVTLNQLVGKPLNQYGAHHQKEWLAAIDAALAWDSAHDNGYTSKEQFRTVYAEQRAGLEKLKDFIVSHAKQLQASNGAPPR